MAFPTTTYTDNESAAAGLTNAAATAGLNLSGLQPTAQLQSAVANLLQSDPTTVAVPAGDVLAGTFGANKSGGADTGTYTFPGALVVTGAVTGVTSLTMSGALSGGTTIAVSSSILSSGAAGGVGYATGAGGTITQGAGSGKATAFTLSKTTGQITTDNASLAAGAIVSAAWTNTSIAITDVVVINHVSGGTVGSYTFNVQCGAGTATLNIRNNTGGALAEALVLQFVVLKGVNA